jgi:hypothetical protein
MASKATSERRRGLHKALLIAAWLATVLVAGPVLAQEEEVVAPTGAIAEPEATPAATTDEAPGDGYQDGEIGGVLIPLEVTPAEPASGQEPDPNSGQPSGVTPDNADAAQEGQSPDDLTGDQNPAQQAALAAEQAAQEARLGASDAEEAAQSTLQQSSATPEDVEFAQRAAQEAQLAASDAEEAAEAAQQAAAREDAPAAEEAPPGKPSRPPRKPSKRRGPFSRSPNKPPNRPSIPSAAPKTLKTRIPKPFKPPGPLATRVTVPPSRPNPTPEKGLILTPRKALLAPARRPPVRTRKPLAAKGFATALPAKPIPKKTSASLGAIPRGSRSPRSRAAFPSC